MHTSNAAAAFTVALTALVTLGISWVATGLVRRYALERAMLDVPNHRSSHTVPTPRGGGAAIGLGFAAGLAALWLSGVIGGALLAGIGGGAVVIALIGWVDDRRDVPALWRFLVQLSAAVWVLWWLGGLPTVTLGSTTVALGIVGSAGAVVAIVWCTNLFNFMDGIDGIAGGQAATAGIFGGALLWLEGERGLAAIALLAAAASIGFLFWNWSPARIFMGDVGSSMLGFVFAALAIGAENTGAVPLPASLLLGGPFVLDATLTLVRRAARGEKWYEAHRSHAYQRAVRSGYTHRQVSTAVILANVVLGLALIATHAAPSAQLVVVAGGFLALTSLYLVVEHRRPMDEGRARSGIARPAEVNE